MSSRRPTRREHAETIPVSDHTYEIRVEGTADGASTRDPVGYGNYDQTWENNLFLRMENVGDTLVRNPWITVNGRRRWRSLEEILDEILTPEMSAAEKARAIWEFARRRRYHTTTADDEVKDTVKMLNVYGYTLCWDEAYTVANLWQAAGLKIRRGVPHGHCTTEVLFDGAYHLLDSDEHLLYLLRDNETIASEEELARDHDLVKRGHAYGILRNENRQTDEQTASVFTYDGPRSGGRPFIDDHRMEIDLRPGESLVWEWTDRGKYHGHGKPPPRLCNGRLLYAPRLDASFDRWVESAENLRSADGHLVPIDPQRESSLTYRVASPYVIVGGHLEPGPAWTAESSRDGRNWTTIVDGDLDPHFPHGAPATYCFLLRLRATGRSLHSLAIETDLQMAPLSLPELERGDNEIRYTDENTTPGAIRVTHAWLERDDWTPPAPPSRPIFPQPGATVSGTRFTFSWEAVPGAADYQFRLSPDPQLRYSLSPVFEKITSKTPSAGRPEWRIPEEGLLNPDTPYYWQVRARSAEGVWGAWSEIWSFLPQAPGLPRDLRLDVDRTGRRITLRWHPPAGGSPADHYEIYGSDERGFTASRTAYPLFAGREEGERTAPANLLATTPETSHLAVAPDLNPEAGNRTFYRVVAVDAEGVRSGPSDYVEAPRPFIRSLPPKTAVAGRTTSYPVRTLKSIGDLRCESDGPRRYFSAFRDGDRLRYILDEGPAFIALDAETGLMTFTPGPEHPGFHTVTFRVQNGQGGVDLQGFDIEVIAEMEATP